MTPKEKAKELVEKFIEYADIWDYTNDQPLPFDATKKCALIAVDEILSLSNDIWGKQYIETMKYWQQVKTEIEKL